MNSKNAAALYHHKKATINQPLPHVGERGGDIKSKDDVIKTAKLYFSRWKIEEYFRCKKQLFQFENFRVRKLKAINSLNFYLTLCMAFGSGQSALHTVNSALSRLFE